MIQAKSIERLRAQSMEIAQEAGTDLETAQRVMEAIKERINKNHRHPRDPAPEGSISLRAAARKYGIPQPTISYWCKTGKIIILKKTVNWTYIDEKGLVKYLNNKK